MNRHVKALVIAVGAVLLSAAPLIATADDSGGTSPAAVATHGGWVCVNWPVHVCVP